MSPAPFEHAKLCPAAGNSDPLEHDIEYPERELAADDRRNLQDFPGALGQTVDAGEQQAVNGVGDVEVCELALQPPALLAAGEQPTFHDRPEYLLDEQGIAFGFRDDELGQLFRERLGLEQGGDESAAVVLAQRPEPKVDETVSEASAQFGHELPSGPEALHPRGEDHEQRRFVHDRQELRESRHRRLVRPVDVLAHD